MLSFTGKANHAAGLLFALRPFLQQLYEAIHAGTGSATSGDRIWTKQIRHSLTWLRSFFKGEVSGVVRHFEVSEFNGDGDQLEIGTDASPYGLGGWIAKEGQILEFSMIPSPTPTQSCTSTRSAAPRDSRHGSVLRFWWRRENGNTRLPTDVYLFASAATKSEPSHWSSSYDPARRSRQ